MTTSIKTCLEAIEVDFKVLGEARRFLERMGKDEFAVEIEKAACRIVQLEGEQ